jgi:magnesium transporter
MVTLIKYNEDFLQSYDLELQDIISEYDEVNNLCNYWFDVDIKYKDYVEVLSDFFEIHTLTKADIFKTEYLPRFEVFEDYFFLTVKMVNLEPDKKIKIEHISFVVGENYIITFQEIPGDVFDVVRNRFNNTTSNLRKRGTDYLLLRLLDAIVDNYSTLLENTRLEIENLEDLILHNPGKKIDLVTEILNIKKTQNKIRSYILPLKDILLRINSETGNFFRKTSLAYIMDIQSQLLFQINSFDTLREMLKDLMDLNNSVMSNEINHIMKILTIISAIFIPLTFIAGLYGMNFKFMPELEHPWGYPTTIIVMLILVLIMILFMKKKKWF